MSTGDCVAVSPQWNHMDVFGLVDPSSRAEEPVNPDRPNHCNNINCVMFWHIKRFSHVLCNLCKADLLKSIIKSNNGIFGPI